MLNIFISIRNVFTPSEKRRCTGCKRRLDRAIDEQIGRDCLCDTDNCIFIKEITENKSILKEFLKLNESHGGNKMSSSSVSIHARYYFYTPFWNSTFCFIIIVYAGWSCQWVRMTWIINWVTNNSYTNLHP